MAEAFRNDVPLSNPQYPQGAANEELSGLNRPPNLDPERELPAGTDYTNSVTARSARNVGRKVGSAVVVLRHFSGRIDDARSHVRSAGRQTSARASAVVLDIMDAATQRTQRLREATESALSDWARSARSAGAQVGAETAESWDHLRRMARERIDYASRRAVGQWNQAQRAVTRIQHEDPLRFLAVVAGAGFVIGAGLRIWRSSND